MLLHPLEGNTVKITRTSQVAMLALLGSLSLAVWLGQQHDDHHPGRDLLSVLIGVDLRRRLLLRNVECRGLIGAEERH